MENSRLYLSDEAVEYLKSAIMKASGGEVFCQGHTGADGIVHSVTILSQGSDFSAPAIINTLAPGNVVIHNHPSGMLKPSHPDVELASYLGNQNIGFYIISNDAELLYPVVKASQPKETIPLSLKDLTGFLRDSGQIACSLDGFEYRKSQADLMEMIARGFNENAVIIAEGATGIGKSMAYLIPAIVWSCTNDERILISTNTINLQEQLIKKDIPFLQQALAYDFKAVLVKGRGNYLCKRKLLAEETEMKQLKIKDEEADELSALIKWGKRTKDGSLSDLNFIPSPEIWEKLNCDTETCLRIKCPHYHDCFLVTARRAAAEANILIVNHHLLFADLALKSNVGAYTDIGILPPYTRVILDEAHHIEDVATSYFGMRVSKNGLIQLLGKLQNRSRSGRIKGALVSLSNAVIRNKKNINQEGLKKLSALINYDLVEKKDALVEEVQSTFTVIGEVLTRLREGKCPMQIRINDERLQSHIRWQGEALEKVKSLFLKLKDFTDDLKEIRKRIKEIENDAGIDLADQLLSYDSIRSRILNAAEVLNGIFFTDEQNRVTWVAVTEGKRGSLISAHSVPLRVSEMLAETLFAEFRTVVLTSATLTVNNEFSFLKGRLGLDVLTTREVRERMFSSPFDYQNQVIIGIPSDVPAPNDPRFGAAVKDAILQAVAASGGRAFVLFTSYYLLDSMYAQLKGVFDEMGISLLRQGDAYRLHLLEQFKKDVSSVLFATDSFWEGVDVEGEALSSVIITKLPFRVPTDPVIKARSEEIEAGGGDSFYEYSLSLAVLKFKQGFGRLIRKRTDRGSVLILDRRIIQMRYGRIFLNSLPECTVHVKPLAAVANDFRSFYS